MNTSNDFKNLQVIIFAMRPGRLAMFERAGTVDEDHLDELDIPVDNTQFVEPVEYFERSKNQPLICLICDEQKILRYLAKGNRRGTVRFSATKGCGAFVLSIRRVGS
ncbi:MAG TPA: hypothetical protein VH280_05860 [Verrucomicrobiae bacterium]|jgi:hypothetical protein|nr:hypothetical protein [Verrucomicrobiae bacterium]